MSRQTAGQMLVEKYHNFVSRVKGMPGVPEMSMESFGSKASFGELLDRFKEASEAQIDLFVREMLVKKDPELLFSQLPPEVQEGDVGLLRRYVECFVELHRLMHPLEQKQ